MPRHMFRARRLAVIVATAVTAALVVLPAPNAFASTAPTISNLTQVNQASAPIADGGFTSDTTVTLGADLADTDRDDVGLQVEVQPVGTTFTGTATDSEATVSPGGTHTLDFTLPAGTYHWQAQAVDTNGDNSGWTTGFQFRVDPAAPNVPANPAQFEYPSNNPLSSPDGITNGSEVVFRADATDPDTSDTVKLQFEVVATGGTFTGTPTDQEPGLTAQGTHSYRIAFLAGTYDWKVRTNDGARVSNWVPGGTFRINAAPNDPTSLAQKSDGAVTIPDGGVTNDSTPTFSGVVTDPDNTPTQTDTLQLEVEMKLQSASFTGTGTQSSSSVTNGQTASVTPSSPLSPGTYHWRARTVDQHGKVSGWQVFGTVTVNFRVNAKPNVPASLAQHDDDGAMSEGALTNDTSISFRANVSDPDNT